MAFDMHGLPTAARQQRLAEHQERGTRDEGRGALRSPAGWLGSAQGPCVRVRSRGPRWSALAWHMRGAAGRHQQQA